MGCVPLAVYATGAECQCETTEGHGVSFAESPLYGVPLATLLENDQKLKPNTATPLFMQEVRTRNSWQGHLS